MVSSFDGSPEPSPRPLPRVVGPLAIAAGLVGVLTFMALALMYGMEVPAGTPVRFFGPLSDWGSGLGTLLVCATILVLPWPAKSRWAMWVAKIAVTVLSVWGSRVVLARVTRHRLRPWHRSRNDSAVRPGHLACGHSVEDRENRYGPAQVGKGGAVAGLSLPGWRGHGRHRVRLAVAGGAVGSVHPWWNCRPRWLGGCPRVVRRPGDTGTSAGQ